MKAVKALALDQLPGYRATVDRTRALTLISGSALGDPVLQYRYEDNAEIVTVPNVWGNQTVAMQAAKLRISADELDRTADGLVLVPMLHRSAEANASRVGDCRRRANLYRLMAARVELKGASAFYGSFQELEAEMTQAA
jgi:hypothetical protein